MLAGVDAPTPEEQALRIARDDRFEGETFRGVALAEQDLGGKEFSDCRFEHCKLQETGWGGARLDEVRFVGCDLTRMRPRRLRAHTVGFSGCKLMGVEWSDLGPFPQLAFDECVLDYASFVDLRLGKTRFVACRIVEANFFDVDLREADFSGSDLTGAIFRGCTFDARTDLSSAIGLLLDPAVNHARGAKISSESATLLAAHLGLRVADFAGPGQAAPARPAARRRK